MTISHLFKVLFLCELYAALCRNCLLLQKKGKGGLLFFRRRPKRKRATIDNDRADKGGKSPCNGKLESFTANAKSYKITTPLLT